MAGKKKPAKPEPQSKTPSKAAATKKGASKASIAEDVPVTKPSAATDVQAGQANKEDAHAIKDTKPNGADDASSEGHNVKSSRDHDTKSTATSDISIKSSDSKTNGKRPISDEDTEEQAPAAKKPRTPIDRNPAKERFPSPPEEPATANDKENWRGWCVLESDPAYFSAMIREFGVQGVSVRQALTMDMDELEALPQPIYGLIFLFRFREMKGEKPEESCPDNVWFANQLPAQNSCSTLAMINILMNVQGVDIGENLRQFRDFTSDFTPRLRGEAFADFKFIKRIHNSFAKKMDMLEDDVSLAEKVKNSKTSGRRGSKDAEVPDDDNESYKDNAHHFIAYLPVDGEVWKLDGMDAQPTALGEADDWLETACNRITMLMAAADDNDYSLLALVQSPLAARRKQLALSVVTSNRVESRLDELEQDWRSFVVVDGDDSVPVPLSPTLVSSLGVTQEQLSNTTLPTTEKKEIGGEQLPELLVRRETLARDQSSLSQEIMAEMEVEASEDEKAAARKWDYGPVIKKWMEMLAENGYLEANIDRFKKK